MRNVSGHQCKMKMSGSEKQVNENTYDISSKKRVTKTFLEVSRCSRAKLLFCNLGTGHYLCGGGGGEKSWGGPGLFFFSEKGWAEREFHDHWGWVIVCFVKNHTHYNSCGRSK